MSSILEVKDLSIGYKNPLQKDLNFNLSNGEILFIKGRNGSGKSTLIKTLCNELKSLSGSVNWNIKENTISILPQVVSHEFPISMTLGEVIELFKPKSQVYNFFPDSLRNRCFNDASGGERQRTLILSRLHENTEVLILDEPFNHLDQEASKEMMSFISTLVEQKVIKGIILISHVSIDSDNHRIKEVLLS